MYSPRNLFTEDMTGPIAASPRAQSDLPPMLSDMSSSRSASSRLPSPRSRRSRIDSIQLHPSRHGVHCPHDSWAENFDSGQRASTMQTESSSTMMPAEPSIDPAFMAASKFNGVPLSSVVSVGGDAPPGITAF